MSPTNTNKVADSEWLTAGVTPTKRARVEASERTLVESTYAENVTLTPENKELDSCFSNLDKILGDDCGSDKSTSQGECADENN